MKKFNIICVDDQREVLAAVQKDLAFFEPITEIIECESAAEAEEVLEELYLDEKPVALLLCDHIMPDENGIDFLARLKKDNRFKDIRTILLTGLATHQDTIDAINKARISNYIEKPWNAENLKNDIKILITQYIVEKGIEYNSYNDFLDSDTLVTELRNKTTY